MKTFFIVMAIVLGSILLILLVSYILTTILLRKSFKRMDFVKGNGLISYDDIKDKYSREEYSFKSKRNTIKAYLYKGTKPDDVIVYVHGMCPGHEGYTSDITSLVDRGYNVFTYDYTATGNSEGKYYSGLDQQLKDLKCAMEFLKQNNYLGFKNIYMYGHSMGGYAVAAYNDDVIKAKVSISGFNDPISEIVAALGNGKDKFIMALMSFILHLKYFIERGVNYNVKAHKMLMKTNSHTLIIHGTKDETVPFEKVSIYSKKDLINNEKVEYLKMDDELHNTHNSVIASSDCVLYQRKMQEIYNDETKKGKSPQVARDAMLKRIDPFKFNVANEELMDIIQKFFESN